jgi:hypothetical protein
MSSRGPRGYVLPSADSGFGNQDFITSDGVHNVALAVYDKIGGLSGTENPTVSWTVSSDVAAVTADFKASGGGGGGTNKTLTLLGVGN